MIDHGVLASVNSIPLQLSEIFHELVGGAAYSRVADVSLIGANARARARRLYLFECDSEDLTLVSILRRGWRVDADGLRQLNAGEWPTCDGSPSANWLAENPHIRFATDGRRVRFGMTLGTSWYCVKEGPLLLAGGFDSKHLLARYSTT